MSAFSSPRSRGPQPPQEPSPFFDGTRVGLEGAMLAVLAIAIPAGLHIGLSASLRHLVRFAEGAAGQGRAFAPVPFLFASLLGIVALGVLLFFANAIPTMAYGIGLVALMLRWPRKWRGSEKRVSTVTGALLGLAVGLLVAAAGSLLLDIGLSWGLYAQLLRWPAILTIDGIALLWLTITPVAHAVAGAQLGWKVGKQVEDFFLYRFW